VRRAWLLLLICAVGAFFAWRERPIERSPGVLAPDPPLQQPLGADAPVFHKGSLPDQGAGGIRP